MIHPIPSGTRDVLPDELRELRVITDGIREVFDARGYGEVATPTIEYDEVLKYGGSIHCTTMQLVRDEAPRVFD